MNKAYSIILLALLICGTRVAVARGADDGRCDQPKEHFVNVEKTRLRYVEAGTGPAVVLIHGNAGSVDDFDFNSLGLLCRDHTVIAVDRPGHGKSDRPDGAATLGYQTHMLHEALSQLGVTCPVLVGHSWGGSLALDYAVEYPKDLSAIILLAPAAYSDGGPDQFMRAVLKTPLIGDATITLGRILFGKHMVKDWRKRFIQPPCPKRTCAKPLPRGCDTSRCARFSKTNTVSTKISTR
jgi:pimeloyl-ACP methyl ester carboxylesterase